MDTRDGKIIVTGGLGFIGSHLVDDLVLLDEDVIIIDNKISNVVKDNKKCCVFIGDVHKILPKIEEDVKAVFHLASFVGPAGILKYAGEIGYQTIRDVIVVRDFCIKNNAIMIDISTSEVYGHDGELREDSYKVFPGEYQIRTEYGAAKMTSEISIVNKVKVNNRLKYHIIRPFNVAGPRQRPDGGFVLPRFVIAALTNQPITVFDDGKQRRAFTDVKDVVDAIITIWKSDYENHIWNIGNESNERSIEDLAVMVLRKIKEIYNSSSSIIYVNPKDIHGDLFSEAVDKIPFTFKLKKLLGWRSKISIEKTIESVVEFYKDMIDNGYNFDMGAE